MEHFVYLVYAGGQHDIPNGHWSEGSLVRKSCTGPNGQSPTGR